MGQLLAAIPAAIAPFLGAGTAAAGATAAAGGTLAAGAGAAGALGGTVATGLGVAAPAVAAASPGLAASTAALSAAAPFTAAGLAPTASTIGAASITPASAGILGTGITAGGLAKGATLAASLSPAAALLGPKPPKPPAPPQAPNLFGGSQGATAFFGPLEGTKGGTFLSGSNRAPQISGGKKTLLGA